MLTKEEEKKALKRIAAILEELEEKDADSYVVTAFRGCVDAARQNIEQDAAFNFMDAAEAANKRTEAAEGRYKVTEEARAALAEENARLRDRIDRARVNLAKNETREAIGNAYEAAAAAVAEAVEAVKRVTECYADDGETLEAVRAYRIATATAARMNTARIAYDEAARDLAAAALL